MGAHTAKARPSGRQPLISFALPVRNGAATIAEAIASIQAQTLDDWELVISDNLSSDGTSEICASYSACDDRIRHLPTGRDLSLHENFHRAFHHTRGTYVRWYGDDDWLDAEYAERAVAVLEASSEAVLCTTIQRYYRDEAPLPINDPIPRLGGVDSADPRKRVRALLRLFEKGGHLGIDPVYSLVRRDVAARTSLQPTIRYGDFVYCCEVALLGPFVHVPELLAHRRLATAQRTSNSATGASSLTPLSQHLQRELSVLHVVRASRSLDLVARLRLGADLIAFATREHAHGLRRRARRRMMATK